MGRGAMAHSSQSYSHCVLVRIYQDDLPAGGSFPVEQCEWFPWRLHRSGRSYKNMNQNADYIPHAKNAARLAEQIAFETDESLVGGGQGRPARKAVYVPNFFTAEPQPVVASGVSQAQTVELPVYHNAYRAPDQQVVYA